MDKTDPDVNVMGVMALELVGGTTPAKAALAPDPAGALVELLGRDLAELVPQVRELELSFAGAHFDPAEALRPGWPLHRRLDELRARAPERNSGPRLLAFGADTAGEVPLPFQADTTLAGGSLRVLPFLLSGPAQTVEAVGHALEEQLLAMGMAKPDTALLAQEAFGAQIEHARYLTVHDLVAMVAMQYDNQGLAPLWPLIEAALLQPEAEEWLDAPPEPLLRYVDGEVRVALFDPPGWCQHYCLGDDDCERMTRQYEHFLARQRQIAVVLEAHGVPLLFVHNHGDARQELSA